MAGSTTANGNEPSPRVQASNASGRRGKKKGTAFWLVFFALCVTTFLAALELTSVSTALPTISHDLSLDTSFVWVGNAYSLASTACFPLSSTLAQIWGRKSVMLGSIVLFAVGSALAGAAKNAGMIISGRTLQGMGSSGILCLGDVIIADMVPLNERGMYTGLLSLVFVVASAIGPLIGGVLASRASWRWLFYINLPLCGIAFVQCMIFLRLKSRILTWREKLAEMDFVGNALIIASTTGCILGLTWAGAKYPWVSTQVLVPFIGGWLLLALAFVYEFKWAKNPIIPVSILNPTSLSGYLCNGLYGLISATIIYYLPVYFQACKLASAFQSALDIFGLAFTFAPSAIVAAISTSVFGKYRPQMYLGWIITILGIVLLSTLKADSSKALWVVYQILSGVGLGIVIGCCLFPVLAPLPVSKSAHALGFFFFIRAFFQTWGLSIGTAVIQNSLLARLPSDFISTIQNSTTSSVLASTDLSYSAIILLPTLPEPILTQVRVAFAESLSMVWKVMAGFAGLGLVVTIMLMKEVPIKTELDENWGLEQDIDGEIDGDEVPVRPRSDREMEEVLR